MNIDTDIMIAEIDEALDKIRKRELEEKDKEIERYKNIIDELILTGLASSMTKEDFEHMWKVAYDKEYNPDDIQEIAERHEILKGE